jgi:F0F1-type ATP synthase assembly protein I
VPANLPDPKDLGHYYSLAQVGLEMVVPVAAGLILESYVAVRPWGVVVGAVLGLTLGLVHLVTLLNRRDKGKPGNMRRDDP